MGTSFQIQMKAQQPDWSNPEVLQINTEKPRATFFGYTSMEGAEAYNPSNSERYKLLNGDWKFNWSPTPADRPMGFYGSRFDDSGWGTIPVPSNWEIEGHGTAVYVNNGYPFAKDEPRIDPNDNPVGSYRHRFVVPNNWKDKQVFLTFDGVISAFYIWVNGEKIGYSQGSRTPAEFDITQYVDSGENQLAVEVYRWCDGSYLEDQDFWRLSGIFRDVYLQARPSTFLRDIRIVTDLDEQFADADLEFDLELSGLMKGYVEAVLKDEFGRVVFEDRKPVSEKVSFRTRIKSPKKWSNESPNLYTLYTSIHDANGVLLETIPQRVGFREVDFDGLAFRVNGVPIKLKGVNRHEAHPDLGQVVTRESMLRDIRLFKENNINAVRTSHYPNVPLFYDLCDKYGIWVMDEANIESHAYGTPYRLNQNLGNPIANKEYWKQSHLNRVERMAARDKNHPSIIMWSLGNEAGIGPNHDASYALLKEQYPTRPVQYQGEQRTGLPASDLHSTMYSLPGWTSDEEAFEASKPSIICEYTHAMGNSNGNLKEYWDHIYETSSHAGAFVWDWMDQGLRKPVPEKYRKNIGMGPVKESAFAYGGWEEHPYRHHGSFCMNGLLASDWTPHPGLAAVKYVYRNVHVRPVDLAEGVFTIRNWFDYSKLADKVVGEWILEGDGLEIARGAISGLEIAPHAEREVAIPLPAISPRPGVDYFVKFHFRAKGEADPMLAGGHLLAWDQFKLPVYERPVVVNSSSSAPLVDRIGTQLRVKGDRFEVAFDARTGGILFWDFDGVRLLKRGPQLDLWRSFTDNDKAPIEKNVYNDIWRDAVAKGTVSDVNVEMLPNAVRVTVHNDLLSVDAKSKMVQTVYGDGEIRIEVEFSRSLETDLRNPHRLGTELLVSPQFEYIDWLGRGPAATYSDRNYEMVGLFESTVDDQWVDYSRPQENGNKTDIRWFSLTDKRGFGLNIEAIGGPLSVGAKFYSKETIESSDYSFQMERSNNVFLNIDHQQLGVGGNNSWGSPAMKPYQLRKPYYRYAYRMLPVEGEE